MRGRKPKPNAMKVAEGSPLVHPEPDFSNGVGSPPSHLDEVAKTEWKRIADMMAVHGILKQTDRTVLAAYCAVYGQWVAAQKIIDKEGITTTGASGVVMVHPATRIKTQSIALLRQYLAELGLTPATRQRLGGGLKPAKPGDDLAGFMKIAQ